MVLACSIQHQQDQQAPPPSRRRSCWGIHGCCGSKATARAMLTPSAEEPSKNSKDYESDHNKHNDGHHGYLIEQRERLGRRFWGGWRKRLRI